MRVDLVRRCRRCLDEIQPEDVIMTATYILFRAFSSANYLHESNELRADVAVTWLKRRPVHRREVARLPTPVSKVKHLRQPRRNSARAQSSHPKPIHLPIFSGLDPHLGPFELAIALNPRLVLCWIASGPRSSLPTTVCPSPWTHDRL